MFLPTVKQVAKRILPARLWRRAREIRYELPIRIRDFIPDVTERLRVHNGRVPLPPAGVRRSVSLSSSRAEYVRVGKLVAENIVAAFDATRAPTQQYPSWLDFGSGPGRVAQFLEDRKGIDRYIGIDVDARATSWADRKLKGRYLTIASSPPTPLSSASVDVACAISVFSHLAEADQVAWLSELSRLLRPGGLLIASTLSERLTYSRPDLSPDQHERLQQSGFLFAPGDGPFSDDSAFHTRRYMKSVWAREFRLRHFADHGLGGYQDLSVWER